MVPKGAKVREAKSERFEVRKDRSICVKIKNKLERSQIEEVVKEIHPEIERIYFPRQKIPRFFFVLCSTEENKEEVVKAIKKLKNPTIGPLFPKNILVRPQVIRSKETDIEKKTTIDPLTLVLEAIPKKITTDEIKNFFPKCDDARRFNDKRCYLYFKSLPDAFEAFEKIKTDPVCGFKISVRYRKVKKSVKKGKKNETLASI